MKFACGDLVEIVTREIFDLPGATARPGARGIVQEYLGERVTTTVCILTGGVYGVDFSGLRFLCCQEGLRLVPPDPGREMRDWDDCVWRPVEERIAKLTRDIQEFRRRLERA